MSQRRKVEEEPLLPPWILSLIVRLGPLAVLIGIWWFLSSYVHIPSQYLAPSLGLLALIAIVYFGGRYYKPYYADKKTKRCIARGAKQRLSCRHFMPGARLGGGCGRQREDGRCRYIH